MNRSTGRSLRTSALACALGSVLGAWTSTGCRPVPTQQDPFVTAPRGEPGRPVLSYRWHLPVASRLRDVKPQEFAAPALFGAQLYVGSARGEFRAVSAASGETLWKKDIGAVSAPPVVDHRGRVYVGTVDGHMLCLDAESGSELWRYESRGSILHAPVVTGGQVVFSNEADQVYALDSETGKFRWQYKSETPEEFTLRGHAGVASAGDLVFTGFANGNMVALRQSTGSVAWLTSLKGKAERFVDVDGTPVLFGSTVFVTSSAGGVYAIDEATGLIRWRLPIDGASAVAVDAQRVYVTAADAGVYALDHEGHILWRQGTQAGGEPAAPVLSGDYLIYSLSTSGMYVADKHTGEVHQYFQPGDGVASPPLVVGDELYVLSNRAILYAMYLNRL
jgi:outer membrane protein assembly factor BamB